MTREPVIVKPDINLLDCAKKMVRKRVGSLLLVEKKKLVGFISEKDIQKDIQKYGRRNIALLTNAPTGSVSIVSQTSSGIEPVFSNGYIRKTKLNKNTLICLKITFLYIYNEHFNWY